MSQGKHVLFRLGDSLFALAVLAVDQILPVQHVTKLPRSPVGILGIFQVRGEMVLAIDGRQRFGFPFVEWPQPFIVVRLGDGRFGIRVDAVEGIVTLDSFESPPLEFGCDEAVVGIARDGSRIIGVLDPERLVDKGLLKRTFNPAA